MHRIFESERALELPGFHAQFPPVLPFGPGIHDARAIDSAGVTIGLKLQFHGEVAYLGVEIQAHKTDAEVGFHTSFVVGRSLSLADDVAPERRVLEQVLLDRLRMQWRQNGYK